MAAKKSSGADLSGVEVASLPWAFTQQSPLRTESLINEADRRGVSLDAATLRALYRAGLLSPLVEVLARRVGPPTGPPASEPMTGDSVLATIRVARDKGRLVDPSLVPYKAHLVFDSHQVGRSPTWWNGLVYSWHQLLALEWFRGTLEAKKFTRRGGKWSVTLPPQDDRRVQSADRFRQIALVATAIEARYFPSLDPEWLYLSGLSEDLQSEWKPYRAAFDPIDMSQALSYSAETALEDAEFLLHRAHSLDPLGGQWGQLVRRSPRSAWKDLSGPALSAMDHRIVAELLLLFYEDLISAGKADPLIDLTGINTYHPLTERLSYRRESLDRNLMQLGISPHPRVVLALEGETEERTAPRVWKALELPDAPELVRIINMHGASKDPAIAGALAATPLLEGLGPDGTYWWSTKPPTCFMVACDPEGKFAPTKIARTRQNILDAIKKGLEAQGAEVDDDQLEPLVEIRTWHASCFEFAHFTIEELADGIMLLHHGLDRAALVAELEVVRSRNQDIRQVWSTWKHKPSKRKLADALWPDLERKIREARAEGDMPEIAEILFLAYLKAQGWRHQLFVWPVKSGLVATASP